MKSLLKLRVLFITPEARGGGVRAWLTLLKTSLLYGMVQRNTKRQFWWCAYWFLLQKQFILQLFSAIVEFYFFNDGLLIWQEVSVQSLILRWPIRPMGLLFVFRIGLKEYIIAFQDKLNYREITGRGRIYKNLKRES